MRFESGDVLGGGLQWVVCEQKGVFFFQQRGKARVTSIYFRLPYFLGSVAGRLQESTRPKR